MKTRLLLDHPTSAYLYYETDLPFVPQIGMSIAIRDLTKKMIVTRTHYVCDTNLLRVMVNSDSSEPDKLETLIAQGWVKI